MPSAGKEPGSCVLCCNPDGLPECGEFKHHNVHAVWCTRPVGHVPPHAVCGNGTHGTTQWGEWSNVITDRPWAIK